MMKKIKLSIIVPIYNAEKYIKNTLEFLVKQTVFSESEVILINDGSNDGSLDICNMYSKKFQNILVINQNNMGVSRARNAGLRLAHGEFIAFMDADDIVDKTYYEKLLDLIQKEDADMAIVDYDMIHLDGYIKKHRKCMFCEWNNNDDALKAFFKGYIGNNVIDKIFRKDTIKETFFPENYSIGEDMFFVYLSLKNVSKVVMDTNLDGYHYVIRENSAMTGKFDRRHFDTIKLSQLMVEQLNQNSNLKNYAEAHLIHEICKVMEYSYIHNAVNDFSEEIKNMKRMIKNYKLSYARRYLVKKQFFGILLMRLSPTLYMMAHRMLRIG